MTQSEALLTVLIAALVTLGTRAAAFLLFPASKEAPPFIRWMSVRLPRAVMAMLVIYCLKDLSFDTSVTWIPALASVALTAGLHLWKRQLMLSIAGGTALYMALFRMLG